MTIQARTRRHLILASSFARFLLSFMFITLPLSAGCMGTTNYVPLTSRSMPKLEKLHVEVDMAEEIDFMDLRLQTTHWIADLFGATGYLIAKNVRQTLDKNVAKTVAHENDSEFVSLMIDRLWGDLMETGQVATLYINKKGAPVQTQDQEAAHLMIHIPSWGLKRIGKDGDTIKAFMDARLNFRLGRSKESLFVDQQVVTLDTNQHLADYQSSPNLLQDDIVHLITVASKRIVEVTIK